MMKSPFVHLRRRLWQLPGLDRMIREVRLLDVRMKRADEEVYAVLCPGAPRNALAAFARCQECPPHHSSSPACLLAAGGNRWDNWAASGGGAMTVPQIVELVIIVIVIYVAVRFFRKRG